MGTLLTTGKFAKDGLIPWKPALAGVIFAFVGSSIGAHIALILDARIFMTAMLFILPVTAFYVTRKKSMTEKEPFSFQKTVLLCCTMAFVIGIYDGFYGPGTGTFLILLLMGIAHIRLKEANGITKVINSTTNLAALFVFLANDVVFLSLGLVAGLFNMAGNYFGACYFEKGGRAKCKTCHYHRSYRLFLQSRLRIISPLNIRRSLYEGFFTFQKTSMQKDRAVTSTILFVYQ